MADLTPNNREEHWLQGMVDGQTTLEPNKRREYWYKEIVDAIGSGGGGGTGGGALIVNDNEGTLDKTYAEIDIAMRNGTVVLIKYEEETGVWLLPVNLATFSHDKYGVYCLSIDTGETPYNIFVWAYETETEDGYPTIVN